MTYFNTSKWCHSPAKWDQPNLMLKLTAYTNCYNTRKLTVIVNFLRTKQYYWSIRKWNTSHLPPASTHPINAKLCFIVSSLTIVDAVRKVLLEIDYYSQFAGVVTISIYSQYEYEIGLVGSYKQDLSRWWVFIFDLYQSSTLFALLINILESRRNICYS